MSKTDKNSSKLKHFAILKNDETEIEWYDAVSLEEALEHYRLEHTGLQEDDEIEIMEVVNWALFSVQPPKPPIIKFVKEDEWKKW